MSETTPPQAFPRRTPVFTTAVVLLCFAFFAWLAYRIYVPHAQPEIKLEGIRTPEERRALLKEHRDKETEESTTYGWVDRDAGSVRLPIERAIELTAKKYSKK